MAEFDIESAEGDLIDLPPELETDWIVLGSLAITSGTVAIGDSSYPVDAKSMKLANGTYAVAVRQYSKDGATYNTRLRVSSRTRYDYDCNIASYGIDSSSVLVADGSIERAYRRLSPEGRDSFFERCLAVTLHSELPSEFTRLPIAWVVATGHGDGLYDIFSLIADEQLVGYETVFIGADPPTLRPRPKRVLP